VAKSKRQDLAGSRYSIAAVTDLTEYLDSRDLARRLLDPCTVGTVTHALLGQGIGEARSWPRALWALC
jgi:hypothetical protein